MGTFRRKTHFHKSLLKLNLTVQVLYTNVRVYQDSLACLMQQNENFKGFFELGTRANNNFSKEYLSGLMSLYAECKVRVDTNQLQDQVFDL